MLGEGRKEGSTVSWTYMLEDPATLVLKIVDFLARQTDRQTDR